jgi:hypothetical protein
MRNPFRLLLSYLRFRLGREFILQRSLFAHFLMVLFVVLTSVGAGLISPPVGLIVAGANCGIYGYLLGSE